MRCVYGLLAQLSGPRLRRTIITAFSLVKLVRTWLAVTKTYANPFVCFLPITKPVPQAGLFSSFIRNVDCITLSLMSADSWPEEAVTSSRLQNTKTAIFFIDYLT